MSGATMFGAAAAAAAGGFGPFAAGPAQAQVNTHFWLVDSRSDIWLVISGCSSWLQFWLSFLGSGSSSSELQSVGIQVILSSDWSTRNFANLWLVVRTDHPYAGQQPAEQHDGRGLGRVAAAEQAMQGLNISSQVINADLWLVDTKQYWSLIGWQAGVVDKEQSSKSEQQENGGAQHQTLQHSKKMSWANIASQVNIDWLTWNNSHLSLVNSLPSPRPRLTQPRPRSLVCCLLQWWWDQVTLSSLVDTKYNSSLTGPGKHNLDIGTWDGSIKHNGALPPPPPLLSTGKYD